MPTSYCAATTARLLRYLSVVLLAVCCLPTLQAQEDSTDVFDMEDFSQYGDAAEVKRYATQKTLNQTPAKLISIGYEGQLGHRLDITGTAPGGVTRGNRVSAAISPRVMANFPIISNDRWIVNLGGQYWGTLYRINAEPPENRLELPASYLHDQMLHSGGALVTVFKPLNQKNFILAQAGADFNAAFPSGQALSARAITFSASAIYGWKHSDRNMIGIGASRTYRMGRVIHVPLLYWNRTLNDRWGYELLLPARGFVRRNFSPQSIGLFGFELEGNQYLLPGARPGNRTLFLQRGEIKPRIQWERQLHNFIWLSLQAGARINGRFNFTDRYYGREEHEIFRTGLGPAPYFNISFNLVSP